VSGIRAHDPYDLDVAAPQRLEHFDRGLARFRGQRSHVPVAADFAAVHVIRDVAMSGIEIGHRADFASAHGVRLAGEAERSCTGLSDLSCREMEVDERSVLVRAVRRLVEPHAVERESATCPPEPARGGDQIFFGDAADACDLTRRVVAHERLQRVVTFRVCGDVGVVDQVLPHQHVQHAIEQRYVRPRLDRKV
jgi:hypothetical protein